MGNKALPAIVLLGAHRWHRQPVIRYAHESGLQPVLLVNGHDQIDIVPELLALVADIIILPSSAKMENVTRQLQQNYFAWYVMALDDYVSEQAAALSQFATEGNYTEQTATIAFQKHLLRTWWNTVCVENPTLPLSTIEYGLYNGDELLSASANFDTIAPPYIVKPNAYAGSVGVFSVTEKERLFSVIKRCGDILLAEQRNPEMVGITVDTNVLVEQQIARKQGLGTCAEYTAHYISINGQHQRLGIAEKQIDTETFIETAHVFPSPSFPDNLKAALHQAVITMLRQLDARNTISNWEFIVTPNHQLAMVEGQLRPSGDGMMELIGLSIGANPYHLYFNGLMQGDVKIPRPTSTSIICWPKPAKPLHKILEVKLPPKIPVGIKISVDNDALLAATNWQGPSSWYNRHISVMVVGNNYLDCELKLRRLLQDIYLVGYGILEQSEITTLQANI